ncbi:MAG TPA: Gfo/Idh/MocA family oxidoreductase [Methanosarcinales archaeon]|nr:Gfo/Idh/MocA family oxidoreductase [Methanosarcinales archaeon]
MKGVGLIGKGYWGAKMFESIYKNPNFNIIWHIGSDKEDILRVLNDKRVEAVFIATPIKTHAKLAVNCLTHGKHVYSAKPLAMTVADMMMVIVTADYKKLHVSVDYTPTFAFGLADFKKKLEALGEIKYIRMENYNWGRFNEYDVYWLYASHMLAMLSLFRPLKELSFSFKDHAIDEEICEEGSIYFNNGVIFVSRIRESREFRINFMCEKGVITYEPVIERPYDIDMSIQHFYNVLIGKEKSNIDMAYEITKIISKRGEKL